MASLITPILDKDTSLSELASFCRKAEKCKFVMNVYFEKHFEQDLVHDLNNSERLQKGT